MTKFTMKIKLFFFLVLPTLLILLLSCNLFDTRDAEEPEGKVNWNLFPITPFQTLENLDYAYNFNENIDRYGSILSDEFEFHFDSQDIQDYNLPPYWGKLMETEMRSLLDKDISLDMQQNEESEDIIQSESAVLYRDYQLILTRLSGTSFFAGSMTLYLQRENDGFWRIYRWEDFRTDNDVTWGRLKYEYIQQ